MPDAIFRTSSPRSASARAPGRGRSFCLALCLAALMATGLRPGLAGATGGGDFEDGDESFFAPEIIDSPDEGPFFLSPHAFYMMQSDGAPSADDIETVNTKEWSAYLRGKVSEPNLGFLIYKMKLGELDKLIWAMDGKKPNLSKQSAALKAELDAVGDKGQVVRALYYLGFAKRCEPIATRRLGDDAWDATILRRQRP